MAENEREVTMYSYRTYCVIIHVCMCTLHACMLSEFAHAIAHTCSILLQLECGRKLSAFFECSVDLARLESEMTAREKDISSPGNACKTPDAEAA